MYEYSTIDSNNTIHSGSIWGWNKHHARTKILKPGHSLIALVRVKKPLRLFQRISKRVSEFEQIVFLRNLMAMLRAGLSLTDALASARDDSSNIVLRTMIIKAEQMIQAGQPLSKAFAGSAQIFSPVTIAMIETGEHSGKLHESLELLVHQKESNYRLRRKIRNSLLYPALIVGSMILMIGIMMITIIPQISSVYVDLNATLPIFTRTLIAVSNGLRAYGLYALVALGVLLIALQRVSKISPRARLVLHGIRLKLPVVGTVIKKLNLALTARSLSMLLHAGVPITTALLLSSKVASNIHYQNAFTEAISFVKRGVALSEVFKGKPKLFPPIFYKIVLTGEATGSLDEMFKQVTRYYEDDINHWAENLTTLLEPILLVTTGVIVGGIAFAILFPLWNLATIL